MDGLDHPSLPSRLLALASLLFLGLSACAHSPAPVCDAGSTCADKGAAKPPAPATALIDPKAEAPAPGTRPPPCKGESEPFCLLTVKVCLLDKSRGCETCRCEEYKGIPVP